jgi:hypothetical protein
MRAVTLYVLLVLLSSIACKRGDNSPVNPSVDPEFDAFETKWVASTKRRANAMREQGKTIDDKDIPTSYRTVYIGRAGIIVDRKLIAKLDELDAKRAAITAAIADNAKHALTFAMNPSVTFDLDAQPAAIGIAALRSFVGQKMNFDRRVDGEGDGDGQAEMCTQITLRGQRTGATEQVELSILLDKDATWVGLSRVDEFQEIPIRGQTYDLEKLEMTLKEHKASAFFTDREDAELAASAGTAGDVLSVLDIACKVGFVDLAVLPRDQLSAVPELDKPTDHLRAR